MARFTARFLGGPADGRIMAMIAPRPAVRFPVAPVLKVGRFDCPEEPDPFAAVETTIYELDRAGLGDHGELRYRWRP